MDSTKYIMWVADVDLEENEIYAEGYKVDDDSEIRYQVEIDIDELREDIGQEKLDEMLDMNQVNSHSVRILPDFRTGRIFYIHINEETGEESVEVPEYKPFTEEEIEDVKKNAKKMADELLKGLRWEDDDKFDSSDN